MSKYIIYFGKNPEELENGYWCDGFDLDETDVIEAETVGKFETDDDDFFWQMLLNLRDNPPCMWYWVFINGNNYLSGAVDPDDYNSLLEEYSLNIPMWVYEKFGVIKLNTELYYILNNPETYITEDTDTVLAQIEDTKIMLGKEADRYYFVIEDDEVTKDLYIEQEFPNNSLIEAFNEIEKSVFDEVFR